VAGASVVVEAVMVAVMRTLAAEAMVVRVMEMDSGTLVTVVAVAAAPPLTLAVVTLLIEMLPHLGPEFVGNCQI